MPKIIKIFSDQSGQPEMSEERRRVLVDLLRGEPSGPPSSWNSMAVVPQYGVGQGLVDMGNKLASAWVSKEAADAETRRKEKEKERRRLALAAAISGQRVPPDEDNDAARAKLAEIEQRLQAYQDFIEAGGDAQTAGMAMKLGEGRDPLDVDPSKFSSESWQAYVKTRDPSVLVPYRDPNGGTAQAAMIQEYGLYKQQMAEAGKQPLDLLSYIRKRNENEAAMRLGSSPGLGTFVFDPSRGAQTPIRTVSSPEDERAAAAAAAQAEADARKRGEAAGQRAATLNSDLAHIDDEIERTQRILSEFKADKYQTGPLAGKLPNWRTASQELAREQGKDVISAISSATFGALSEGEREFLRNLGISEGNTEEANISLLEQREKELKRARDRLRSQGLSGGFSSAAPIAPGESTTIDGAKVTRKK